MERPCLKKVPTNVFIREVLIPKVLNYTRKSKYPRKWFGILGGGLCFLNRPMVRRNSVNFTEEIENVKRVKYTGVYNEGS